VEVQYWQACLGGHSRVAEYLDNGPSRPYRKYGTPHTAYVDRVWVDVCFARCSHQEDIYARLARGRAYSAVDEPL
jgi:hypothetical protein